VRHYSDTRFVHGDKHKVLQVLVNLITNAKHAMSASTIKTLTLSTETGPAGEVRVSVGDTGCGIAPENMTRLFSYGFTTKTGGHGFGLHSSVLAAKEMKGTLTVRSAGPGLGAILTLELPSAAPQELAA
jgi:two-component system, NtrC family, sensor kinase